MQYLKRFSEVNISKLTLFSTKEDIMHRWMYFILTFGHFFNGIVSENSSTVVT